MNKIMAVFSGLIYKIFISKKDMLIENINKKLDFPLMTEEDEKQLLEGLFDMVDDAMKDTFKK
tara:strand:- start:3846 stop:4034 length:189 start_codon:yes stop_codon:yes gene_type:complete